MEQALVGARTIGDASMVARSLQMLGGYAFRMGDITRGLALVDESLAVARHLDDDVDAMLSTVFWVAWSLLLVPGEEDRVVALAEEALETAQRVGRPAWEVTARRVLAVSALLRGDLLQAEEQALRSLRLARDLDLTLDMLTVAEIVGLVAGQTGDAVKSARMLGAAKALSEAAGMADDPDWEEPIEAMVASAREALGQEQWAIAFAAGRSLTLEEAVAEALEELSLY
jgi:non-specific serine/threonine protein kinase